MSGLRFTPMLLLGAAMPFILSACATAPAGGARSFALGQNGNGESCTASQNWTDARHYDGYIKFSDVFSVSCTGQTTGAVARVRTFNSVGERNEFGGSFSCGEAVPVSLAGFSETRARRCFDSDLGRTTIVMDTGYAGTSYQISAAPNAVGAAYQAALIVAGIESSDGATSDRVPFSTTIPDLPPDFVFTSAASTTREALATVLSRGSALSFRGRNEDASRVLRQSLNSLSEEAPDRTRAELLLDAALADSNIRFFETAETKLDAADIIISGLTTADQRILRPKLGTYRGLHALNQNEYAEASRLLSPLCRASARSGQNLFDPITLVQINTSTAEEGDVRSSISLTDLQVLRESYISVLGCRALSVAELALGKPEAARAANDVALQGLSDLRASFEAADVEDAALVSLNAKLLRQQARTASYNRDYEQAIGFADEALDQERRASRARLGTLNDPAIAELLVERAGYVKSSSRPRAEKDEARERALDAIVAASESSSTLPTGLLVPFLDDFANQMAAGDSAAAARYFEVIQVSGEGGAARQVSQLQEIISQESELGVKERQRQALEQRLTSLEIDIVDAQQLGVPTDALEAERREAQDQFALLDAQLQADPRLSQVSSKPVELAALQDTLKPGEAYVRFTVMGERVFGAFVEKDSIVPIRPEFSAEDLKVLAAIVRYSIDGQIEERELTQFAVPTSAALFNQLFGEAEAVLRTKEELVVDGGEVLAGLPPAVLVTDDAAVRRFLEQEDRFDYTQIEFLASLMPTSVAMSPRSFIASRNFAPSKASQPLIGFAAPETVASGRLAADERYQVGPCLLTGEQLEDWSNRFVPIPDTDIRLASQALGLSQAPRIIRGGEFSDTRVRRMGAQSGDLSEYKVLHFSTHGVTEGQFDCADAPAALITSLGDDAESDLLLSFAEIAQLRLDANLVVLAACETASETGEVAQQRAGEARPGSTLEGLVRAFFAAQARAVMATYWEASNEAPTEEFMAEFYRAGRTNDIASSLNQAQRSLMVDDDTSHPFFWGGFFVVGDTDNRMLDGPNVQVAMN